jgi:hypothetical protein
MFQRLIVCAAIRHKETGVMICGVRHGHCLASVRRQGLDDKPYKSKMWECGFVDQNNLFLTREEAWKVADAAGQIRRPFGFEKSYEDHRKPNVGDEGLLFSENLY